MRLTRRLLAGGGVLSLVRPARATPGEAAAEIAKVLDGRPLRTGRVTLDLSSMVENGNAVGVSVSANAPEGTRVASLHLFAEGNPAPNVFHAVIGPAGLPRFSTRIRLATSQNVVAIAVMADGSCWSDSVTTMVTLAACLE